MLRGVELSSTVKTFCRLTGHHIREAIKEHGSPNKSALQALVLEVPRLHQEEGDRIGDLNLRFLDWSDALCSGCASGLGGCAVGGGSTTHEGNRGLTPGRTKKWQRREQRGSDMHLRGHTKVTRPSSSGDTFLLRANQLAASNCAVHRWWERDVLTLLSSFSLEAATGGR